jgi:hypothetical protein
MIGDRSCPIGTLSLPVGEIIGAEGDGIALWIDDEDITTAKTVEVKGIRIHKNHSCNREAS